MRPSLFGIIKSRLKTSVLFSLALLLSVSALFNLAPSFLRPVYAKNNSQTLCDFPIGNGCKNVVMLTSSESGSEVPEGNNFYSLPAAETYYFRVGKITSYDDSDVPVFGVIPGEPLTLFISTKPDFSDTLQSVNLSNSICPSGAKKPSDCADTSKYKLHFYNGKSSINCTGGVCSGTLTPSTLSSLGIPDKFNYSLKKSTAVTTVKITTDDSGEEVATVTETTEDGETTEETVAVTDTSDTVEPTDTADITCNKATGALGWIICSVGNLAATALRGLYELAIIPALRIKTSLLDTHNGTYAVWATFRDFANILFVIYLLVIIFSQLTGIGIDNYGIKKSLPRLIVAAILINLSYFICQAAVDLSNILGASLYNFLSHVEIGNAYSEFLDSFGDFAGRSGADISSNFVTYLVAGGFAAGTIWAYGGFAGAVSFAVVPIFGAIIGAFVSVFFMFALLAFRNAVVVIGVALSPLAFVCYMLPNTKKIFDRWLEIMKGMILLYPICSIVIGGGYLASRIILGSGGADSDVFLVVSAVVAEVAPFFAVPSIVRSAYKATGQLGMRLNHMSLMSSRRAQMGFRRSDWAQTRTDIAQTRRARGITLRRSARNRNSRINRIITNDRTLSDANKALLAGEQREQENTAMTDAENVAALSTQQRIAARAQLEKNREYTRQLSGTSQNPPIEINGANISAQSLEKATIQQAIINQEGQLRGVQMFENESYRTMRRGQQDAAISNETTKMYAESFKNLAPLDIQKQLAKAINEVNSANQAEKITAALQTLLASKSEKEIMEVLAGDNQNVDGYATVSANLSSAMRSNVNLRNMVSQQLAMSGNMVLKEYSKTNGAVSFADFVDNGGLTAALNKKGESAISGMNKDTLDFLSQDNHVSALASLDNKYFSEAFGNAMATHNSGEENTKLNQILNKLEDKQKETIISSLTPQQFTLASDASRSTLRVKRNGDIYSVNDYRLGRMDNDGGTFEKQVDEIRKNPQLKGQFKPVEISKYNIE